MDIGLYEDLIDNYIDLFKVEAAKAVEQVGERNISKVQKLMRFVRRRNSVRFHRLLDKLHEEGLGMSESSSKSDEE